METVSADEGRTDESTGSREAGQPAGRDAADSRGEAGKRRGEAQRARGEDVREGQLHQEDRAPAIILQDALPVRLKLEQS
jgi:hypothetical protein